jgi:hypothetical protein
MATNFFDENFDPDTFGAIDPLTANQADSPIGLQAIPTPDGRLRVPQQFQGMPIGPNLTGPPVAQPFVSDQSQAQRDAFALLDQINQGNAPPLSPNQSLQQRSAFDQQQQPAPNIFNPQPAPQSSAQDILQQMSAVQGQMGQPQQAQNLPRGGVGSEVGLPPVELTPSGGLSPQEQKAQDDRQAFLNAGGGFTGLEKPTFDPATGGRSKDGSTEFDVAGLAESLGGGPDAVKEAQKIVREQMRKEVGSTREAKRVIESLKEQGMKEEDIQSLLGTPEQRKGMSNYQAFKKLNKELKKRSGVSKLPAKDKRQRDAISNKSTYNPDGTAKDDAAVANDHIKFFDDTGPDPDGDGKTNESFLTPSQRREYEKYKGIAATGKVDDRLQRRMDKFQDDISTKRGKEFEKKQAQRGEESRKSLIESRIASARNAEESKYYSVRDKKIKALEAKIKVPGTKGKEKIRLRGEINLINDEILAGYTAPEADATPSVTTQEQFDALPPGAQYKNNSGQIATKPKE